MKSQLFINMICTFYNYVIKVFLLVIKCAAYTELKLRLRLQENFVSVEV